MLMATLPKMSKEECKLLTFRFTGSDGCMVKNETLTSGTIGKKVKLEFSEEWRNLKKTAVFMAGSVTRDVLDVSDEVVIPADVLAVPLKQLYVGVYGVSLDGSVTSTIRVPGPMIALGTDPAGDEGSDPSLPIWAQLQGMIGELRNLNTDDRSNLVSAVNEAMNISGGAGGYYTPVVTQPTGNTMKISFAPSVATMPNLEPVTITLPGSDSGQNDAGIYVGDTAPEDISLLWVDTADSKEDEDSVAKAIEAALVEAKESGEFNGADGQDGYTPVRGTDYWTAADIAEIKSYVDTAILGGAW